MKKLLFTIAVVTAVAVVRKLKSTKLENAVKEKLVDDVPMFTLDCTFGDFELYLTDKEAQDILEVYHTKDNIVGAFQRIYNHLGLDIGEVTKLGIAQTAELLETCEKIDYARRCEYIEDMAKGQNFDFFEKQISPKGFQKVCKVVSTISERQRWLNLMCTDMTEKFEWFSTEDQADEVIAYVKSYTDLPHENMAKSVELAKIAREEAEKLNTPIEKRLDDEVGILPDGCDSFEDIEDMEENGYW